MDAMSRAIPSRLRATGQAIFAAVVFGLGNAVGFQLSGLGYDRWHGVGPLFAWAAGAEGVALARPLRPSGIAPQRRSRSRFAPMTWRSTRKSSAVETASVRASWAS